MRERIQVKLNVNLTQYFPGLVAGTEGYTIGNFGMWSRGNDNFTGVHFPGVGTLDVLWSSLEIIDQDYLIEIDRRKKQQLEEFKTATEIIKHVGPRGGFKSLSFKYVNDTGGIVHYSIGFKQEAERLIDYFKEYNLNVEEKVMK